MEQGIGFIVAERILCIFSFAHNPVSVTVDLPGLEGRALSDLFGGSAFPAIGEDGRLTLTLGSQNFYWLHVGERSVAGPA